MVDLPFPVGSVKERVLQTVWKLGRCASRGLIFRARISTDVTVDAALSGLMRDGFLALGPGEIYQLTDQGYAAIEQEPGAAYRGEPPVVVEQTRRTPVNKLCRTCRRPKPLSEFDYAPRSPDRRTRDCTECRKGSPVTSPPVSGPETGARLNEVQSAGTPPAESASPGAARVDASQLPAPKDVAGREVLVFTIPSDLGVYARIEGDRVYISQPLCNDTHDLHLTRERALQLAMFLVEHLGGA